MVDPQARFEAVVGRLRKEGHRLTPQRMAVLRLLAVSDGHPSASELYQQIHAQLPTMSLATVYKTLNLLKELGEVLELAFGGGDNHYDGKKPYPHPHVICVRCRKIMDSEVSMTQELVEEVAQESSYQMISHRLDFYGVCPDCQQEQQARNRANSGNADD